jgi:hypothetical protein
MAEGIVGVDGGGGTGGRMLINNSRWRGKVGFRHVDPKGVANSQPSTFPRD